MSGREPIEPWHGRARRRAALALAAVSVLVVGASLIGTARQPAPDALRAETAGATPAPALPAERKRDREGSAERAASSFALQPSPARPRVRHEFSSPPRAGLLFDVDSGEILWERRPDRRLPIASLTKMMTALLIAERHRPGELVKISRTATEVGGSMVGLLPRGKEVRLEPLLYGLMLASGNDAAHALAEHDSGSASRFVARMNRRARRMGLDCTRFSSPHGLVDSGNRSCPRDLAVLARADLGNRRLRRIARAERARFRFPIKGRFLDLSNNNPLIRAGERGVTGLKTGYTSAAGRCYVMSARRGARHLGVVLLDSPDPVRQVGKLFKLGSKA